MAMKYPWEDLKFVSKVEIVPGDGNKSVNVTLREDNEYEQWYDSLVRKPVLISRDRQLLLTNETVNFHYDYPDQFKKLVAFYRGNFSNAYDVYQALQKAVPGDWDKLQDDKVSIDDCDCC